MKFFIPGEEDTSQRDQVYEAICKFNAQELAATISPRRIYHLDFVHEGKSYTATVGKQFERLGETVIAILLDSARNCYLICTPNRGVIRGMPYLSGAHEIRRSEDFEA